MSTRTPVFKGHPIAALAFICLSVFVISVDATIVNVALPTLSRDLDADTAQLQWIVDAYTLVMAGLMLSAGSLSDRFGRRGWLSAGLALFAITSAVAAQVDSADTLIAARAGARVFHIGPERDLPLFDGLAAPMAPLERADYVVCSGLLDDTVETPRDYEELVVRMCARALPMICANPDVVVERGDKLVYCAGAIADLYAAAGGEVVYAGKPYRPIYEQALSVAEAARGAPVAHHRLLAIGDSVRTDLKGAAALGIDSLFVTAGIHAEELGERHAPDTLALSNIFAAAGVVPKAVMSRLTW